MPLLGPVWELAFVTLRLLWEAVEQETLLSSCDSVLGFVQETESRSRDCILSISREKLRCFFFFGDRICKIFK